MSEETKTPEETLWEDMNAALFRCKKILGFCELPRLADDGETLEMALAKITIILNDLCDRIEKPRIIL